MSPRVRPQRKQRIRSSVELRTGTCLFVLTQCILLFVLLALPLFWGGRSHFAWGSAGGLLCLAFVCSLWATALHGKVRLSPCPCYGLVFFALLLCVGYAQLSPCLSRILAPEFSLNLWASLETLFHVEAIPLASLTPVEHREMLLIIALAGLVYFLLCCSFRSEKALLILALSILGIAALYALLGLLQYLNCDAFLLFVYTGENKAISGAFVNKNHFAFMQELGFFVGLGLVSALMVKGQTSLRSLCGKFFPAICIFASASTAFCALGLVLSYSRAGIFASLVGLILFVSYLAVRRQKRVLALLLCILGASLLLLCYYGLGTVVERLLFALSGEDTSGLARLEFWQTALELIEKSPLIGMGYGAFRYVAPLLSPSLGTDATAFNVHNDYVEFALVFGLPCALLCLALALFFFVKTLCLFMRNSHSSWHYLGMGALCAVFVSMGHEVFDYGLQQPANMFLFCAVVALSALCADTIRQKEHAEKQSSWRLGRSVYVMAGLLSLCACYAARPYIEYARAGFYVEKALSLQNEPHIIKTMPPIARQKAIATYCEKALAIEPTLRVALEDYAIAQTELARLELAQLYAEKMSRQLGRTISEERVWREQHTRTRMAVYETFSPAEKTRIATLYGEAAQSYRTLLEQAPTDALSLATLAFADYNEHFWNYDDRAGASQALSYMAFARKLYPEQAGVGRTAVTLYAQKLYKTRLSASERAHINTLFWQSLRDVLAASPQDIRTLLPVAWSVGQDKAFLEELVPQNTYGFELLYLFWRDLEEWEEAEKALLRLFSYNAMRPDEGESVEELGRLQFIRKERRSKEELQLQIMEYFTQTYKALGKENALAQAEEQAKLLRYKRDIPQIKQIDKLLARGEYLLAEAKIKRLKDNPSALLRYARILYNASRTAHFVRTMHKLEEDKGLLTDEEAQEYLELQKHL